MRHCLGAHAFRDRPGNWGRTSVGSGGSAISSWRLLLGRQLHHLHCGSRVHVRLVRRQPNRRAGYEPLQQHLVVQRDGVVLALQNLCLHHLGVNAVVFCHLGKHHGFDRVARAAGRAGIDPIEIGILKQPWMLQKLVHREPGVWTVLEQRADDLLRVGRQPRRDLVESLLDQFVQVLSVFVIKRQKAAQQCVQQNTETPHISFGANVLFTTNQLGRSVRCRATARGQKVLVEVAGTGDQTKVNQFDIRLLIKKKVLRLEIAMCNSVHVAVRQCLNDLAEELPSLVLLTALPGHNIVEELSTMRKL
mmetsp:Transcript_28249/g.74090  ORF Transcript_28249/g.74090 Transcript_28249/m.74090 type:complete len:305 (-) Transcript_28249:564-1478(-)